MFAPWACQNIVCCVVWKRLDSMHVEAKSKRTVRDADPLGQLVPLVLESEIYRANPEPINRWLGSMGQCLGQPKPTHLQPNLDMWFGLMGFQLKAY